MPRSVHEWDPDVNEETEELEYLEAFRIGRALQEFCDTDPAGQYLVRQARSTLQKAINDWLAEDDAKSDKARDAHFRARVAVEQLRIIEQAITAGRNAEAVLSELEAAGEAGVNGAGIYGTG